MAYPEDILCSLKLFHVFLETRKGDPGTRNLWELLKVFFVDGSNSVQLAELLLHLNVSFEDLLPGTHTYSCSKYFSGFLQISTPQMEVCVVNPQFGESKYFVGNQSQGSFIDFVRFEQLLRHLLLKYRVVVPQINVPSPKSLLFCWRYFFNSSFVSFPCPLNILGGLLKLGQINPCIIIQGVLRQQLLVVSSPLTQYALINVLLRTVLFLKIQILVVQLLTFLLGDMLQSKLVDLLGSIVLSVFDLEFGELTEVLLMHGILPEFCDHSLINTSSCISISAFNLKLSHFQIGLKLWEGLQKPVHDLFRIFRFSHPLLELQVRHPSLLSRHPRHPPLKNIPRFGVLPNNFLHVGVFEPKLILPWQIVGGSFPDIPGMVDELVLHFHLSISQPQTLISVFDFQSSLKYGSSTSELLGSLLPLSVAHPGAQIVSLPTNFILKLFALLLFADCQLLLVHNQLSGWTHLNNAMNLRVEQKLVSCYLQFASTLIFNGRRLHVDLGSHIKREALQKTKKLQKTSRQTVDESQEFLNIGI